MGSTIDLLLIHPGGREQAYQHLATGLAAIEPPLWCRLIGGYARDRGWSVAIVDAEAEALTPARVAERVRDLAPRLVGMVVFGHQPSASTQQMVPAGETCRAIKAISPKQPILLLGGHVSALPARTLREEAVDFVCQGEGAVTVDRLLAVLRATERPSAGPEPSATEADAEALSRVPGLGWWRVGAVALNPPAPLIQDLDRDLHGSVWDLLPMDRYRAHNWQCFDDLSRRQPYASIHTSLGCPFKCSFCCINTPFGSQRYRMRSADAVAQDIAHLYETYGVRTFKIVDEMFVLNERHVGDICDRLIALGLPDMNLWAYARIDTVKPHLLAKLRLAGFRWLALGIESGSDHVRDGAQKSMADDDIIAVVRAIQDADIAVIGNYIFGLPDEDMDSLRATMALAKRINCDFANFYVAMAYPGSLLFARAQAEGWPLPDSWGGYAQHAYDCQPLSNGRIEAAEVLRFRDDAFHAYFSDPAYLDGLAARFGPMARAHVEAMARTRLPRRLLAHCRGVT